ncbi:MAG TPA: hypothetical protein VIY98_12735 [Nitrososphaeraceae archaeon]
MNVDDDVNDAINNIIYQHKGVKEILKALLQTPIGIHQIVVYPNNIDILREMYFHYIKKLLEDNNEIVIFFPYYETADSVKNVLSSSTIKKSSNSIKNTDANEEKNNNNKKDVTIEVKRYINNGSLVIIDSDKTFSSEERTINYRGNKYDRIIQSNNNFASLVRMSLYHAKKLKKEGITILADYGLISEKKEYEELLELEKSIPLFFDSIKIKQICLYRQNNFFNKFTRQQQKELLDLHSRSIMMIDSS